MSFEACAGLVERGDPDRFAATMAAPLPARKVLFPIYAFNIEVSRAPWVTAEPMIAEMRLQWWRDVLEEIREGTPPSAHEITVPLSEVLDPDGAEILDALVAARRWDIYRDPFEDDAALDGYLEDTGAGLVWATVRALGAPDAVEPIARAQGWASALARYLQAVPMLEAQGRVPLLDGRPDAVSQLAQRGLDRLGSAESASGAVSLAARPAFLAGWMTRPLLQQAVTEPERVAAGALGISEFRKRARLAWASATGRW